MEVMATEHDVPVEVIEDLEAVKAPAKPKARVKVRTLEELEGASPKNMNPAELRKCLVASLEDRAQKDIQLEQLNKNIEGAYALHRETQQELDKLRYAYTVKMNFITSSIKNLTEAINLAVKGDIK